MPATDAIFVMQIFPAAENIDAAYQWPWGERHSMDAKVEAALQSGMEIEIACQGLLATASIIWITDIPAEGSLRVGLRLHTISAQSKLPPAQTAGPGLETNRSEPLCNAPTTTVLRHVAGSLK